MWTTVPQNVYYRLKAWNVVSTLPRASNLSLEIYLQQNICTPPCFRSTLITNAAPLPPGKGRDSVKLTALSTVIPVTPRTEKGAQFLAAPPMHKIQQNEIIKDYLKYSDKNKRQN